LLPAVEFGDYSLWSPVVLVLSAIASTWLRQGVLRYWKEYDQEPAALRFHSTVFLLMLATCVGLGVIGLIGYPIASRLLPQELIRLYPAGVFSAIFLIVTNVQLSFWQAEFLPVIYTIVRILTSVITLLVSLGLLLFVDSIGALALSLGFMAGYGAAVLVGGLDRWRRLGLTFPQLFRMDRSIARRLWDYGLPFAGWFAGMYVLGMADRYVLRLLSTSAVVGAYSAIYSLINGLVSFIATPIITAAHPSIVAAWTSASGKDAATDVLSEYARLFAMVALPVIAGLAATGQLVAQVLVPDGYAPDGWIMVVVAVGIFASSFSLLAQKGLEMAEQTRCLLVLVAISAIVNPLLSFLLVPLMSARGAAVATLLSYLLYLGLVLWKSRPYLYMRMRRQSLERIGLAALGVFVVAWLLTRHLAWLPPVPRLVIVALVGIVAYGSLLLLLGEVPADKLRSGFTAAMHLAFGVRRLTNKSDDAGLESTTAE
jgi:O-antigen/teichoic acid export membrane protein